jgi:diaminopimelate decarboxylase
MLIGGLSVDDLATRFGTPIFVYDAARIRANIGRVQQAFTAHYPGEHKLYYAVKTNENPVVMAILRDCGAGMDTASVNEIKLAQHIGVQAEDIMFSGNFLSDDDIQAGLASGVVMNLDDGALLPRILAFGLPKIISFRVNPGIGKSNVGHYDITGGPEAKFGVHPDHVIDCYRAAQAAGITRFGVHMMAGSCVTDAAYFKEITERLFAILEEVHEALGITFEFVDLGGGLGIPYRPGEPELDIEAAIQGVAEAITTSCARAHMPLPRIVMEPGRYFVGDAGYLIGRVQFIKESYRRIVGTDLGMNIVPRVVLYGAYHHLRVPGKEHLPPEPTNLCGQICEQTDLWAENRPLPPLAVGDLLVMENAGAYCYGMSYRYNGRLLPAEVLVDGGEAYLIRAAEPFEEMTRGVQFPAHVLSSRPT